MDDPIRLRIEDNLNSNKHVREVLQPEVIPFHQSIPGAISRRIMNAQTLQKLVEICVQPNACKFFLTCLIIIDAHWPSMWFGFAHDPRSAASKDELFLRILSKQFCCRIFFHKHTFKICPMPRRIRVLIATLYDYTKYFSWILIFISLLLKFRYLFVLIQVVCA